MAGGKGMKASELKKYDENEREREKKRDGWNDK